MFHRIFGLRYSEETQKFADVSVSNLVLTTCLRPLLAAVILLFWSGHRWFSGSKLWPDRSVRWVLRNWCAAQRRSWIKAVVLKLDGLALCPFDRFIHSRSISGLSEYLEPSGFHGICALILTLLVMVGAIGTAGLPPFGILYWPLLCWCVAVAS